jgi:hypothetical protein
MDQDRAKHEYQRLVLGGLGYELDGQAARGRDFQEDGPGDAVWQQVLAARER